MNRGTYGTFRRERRPRNLRECQPPTRSRAVLVEPERGQPGTEDRRTGAGQPAGVEMVRGFTHETICLRARSISV